MWLLPKEATDEEILTRSREWIELVAAGRFAEAVDALFVPDDYDDSQRWTPDTLRAYIANYGSRDPWPDGRRWRITSLETASPRPDRPGEGGDASVIRLDADPLAGSVDIDVPLNGNWSDLTAQFEFRPVDGGTALCLYDLHVL